MSTVPVPSPTPPAVLDGIDWPTYTRLMRVLQSHRRYRLTYDRGRLEIRNPLWEHEGPASMLGRFIGHLTLVCKMPLLSGGSVTLRRRRFRRAVEPDNCFWIASAPGMYGRRWLDLRVDPPPDLVVEIDLISSFVPRMPIYARLGVPEVWRVAQNGLSFHVLEAGQYQLREHSLAFPALRSADLVGFLASVGQTDDNAIFREFESWVRQTGQSSGRPSSAQTP